jgi:hypothetical protein
VVSISRDATVQYTNKISEIIVICKLVNIESSKKGMLKSFSLFVFRCLLVLKPNHKTIQFDFGAEHETRQRRIRGKEEEEGRTHAQTIPTDEG